MSKFKSNDGAFGYNLRVDTDGKMIVDQRTSQKISDRLLGEWRSGLRDQHSSKLKNSWSTRDKSFQSAIMKKNLTKYKYHLRFPTGEELITTHRCLSALGYGNVLSNFHRNKCNISFCKGVKIERLSI